MYLVIPFPTPGKPRRLLERLLIFSPFLTKKEWVQALSAVISEIVWEDKFKL